MAPLQVDSLMHAEEIARFGKFVVHGPGEHDCWLWRGCVADDGAGRFWLTGDADTRDYVVIAHRFGYALTHGFDALISVEEVAHRCDNTLCQNPAHWPASTRTENRAE